MSLSGSVAQYGLRRRPPDVNARESRRPGVQIPSGPPLHVHNLAIGDFFSKSAFNDHIIIYTEKNGIFLFTTGIRRDTSPKGKE